MVLLTLDRALSTATAALWRDAECFWTLAWENTLSQPEWVRRLTAQSPIPLNTIDACCVGTGPGSFSGIRAAIAFAQGLTLPGRKKLLGASGIAALSERIGYPVVGDARRGKVWIFDGEFHLEPQATFSPKEPVFTPDAARLSRLFPNSEFKQIHPEPTDLGRYLLAHPEAAAADPEPVYLQPAV